jgi:hypothetical protein
VIFRVPQSVGLRWVSRDHAAERHATREQQETAAHDQRDIEPGKRQQATLIRVAGFSSDVPAATGGSFACSPTGWRPTACPARRNLTRDPAALAAVAGARGLGERSRREGEDSGNGHDSDADSPH